MNKIYYNKNQFKQLIPIQDETGKQKKGTFGRLYRDPNLNKAIKVYNRWIDAHSVNAFRFLNNPFLQQHNVIVPEEKVYKTRLLVGYSMQLVQGCTLYELKTKDHIEEVCFSDFYNAYSKALEDIAQISKEKICIYDLHLDNIMYDTLNKCFKFIDTDEWEISKDSLDVILKTNLQKFHKNLSMTTFEKKLVKK